MKKSIYDILCSKLVSVQEFNAGNCVFQVFLSPQLDFSRCKYCYKCSYNVETDEFFDDENPYPCLSIEEKIIKDIIE